MVGKIDWDNEDFGQWVAQGWMCPACKVIWAPHISCCTCKSKPTTTFTTTTGTSGGPLVVAPAYVNTDKDNVKIYPSNFDGKPVDHAVYGSDLTNGGCKCSFCQKKKEK